MSSWRGAGGAEATMAGRSGPAATAGSMALTSNRGAHPTLRLDNFLRNTDVVFQHGEAPQRGDKFVRKMATYGQVRPSISFTSESRAARPMRDERALDLSNLPNPLLDPHDDPRQCTFEIPPPPAEADDSFMKMFENRSLMLPSERFKEHLAMKAGKLQWEKDRAAKFMYKKRVNVLERHYPNGITGVDGPTYPGTNLYAQRREQLEVQAELKGRQAEGRHNSLAHQLRTDDAVSFRNYAQPHDLQRSQDICIQRKCVDSEKHPFRFLNTHERLFSSFVPVWDPNRARMQRSHDVREKEHCHITGKDNTLTYRVAPRLEEVPQTTINMKDRGAADPLSRSCPNV